jgi:beta-glucosidase
MIKFPKNFLWGAATSAYQVEGNNVNSDWWEWEIESRHEKSGSACRHYELYEQDFDLAKSLNHNVHRLSIEWSRIEPQEGKFSKEALEHYQKVILSLRSRNIEPIVTLHHYTNPIWFAKSGGWENKQSVSYFLRYCDYVASFLAKHVHYWITINEPTIFLYHAYIIGAWPPQIKSFLRANKVENNLVCAHVKTYQLIHKIYKELNIEKPCVGISQFTQAYMPCTQSPQNRFAANLRDKWYNFNFLDKIIRQRSMDFIGINYYSRQVVEFSKPSIANLFMGVCKDNHHPVLKNSLGWDIYPEGLRELLLKLKKYNLPVIITENGICTADDNQRWDYIQSHLKNIHQAMEQGVNVLGYLYWSLMDNFEWDKGFGPRFGLLGIDYNTYKRTVRESAKKYSQVCVSGILE